MRATPEVATVCIVTPAHLASNPRVVKEADALAEAGLRTHVVFAQTASRTLREYDERLLRERAWSHTAVPLATRQDRPIRWLAEVVFQRISQRMPSRLWTVDGIAQRAESRIYRALAKAAAAIKADLYIGHYVGGLAAAAFAAERNESKLGFDAEDFHTGEGGSAAQSARIDFLQRRYLPRCSYLSAASAGIGEALVATYGIPSPHTIHNTFPWVDRESTDGTIRDRRGPALSLYWYSQVIGLDRGIQDAMKAMSIVDAPTQLHLRGAIDDKTKRALESLARDCGISERVHFHPPVSPDELLSRAMEHDVGLALEQGTTLNRAICVTNKLFHFMLAGLAIAATSVPGQERIVRQTPGVGALYHPGDAAGLAQILERWAKSQEQLRLAKLASLDAARQCWNWENESARLSHAVRSSLTDNRPKQPAAQGRLLRQEA